LTASTTFLLRLIGIREAIQETLIPREELKYYIKESRERGVLEETEAQLLHGVFEFADTMVKEIMVPKPKFCAIEINTPPEEVLKLVAETGFSRYPVYKETLDNIVGILFNKDLFRAIEQKKPIVLRELIRPPFFVPNTIMISTLLRDMQKRKTHIAIVVDEHGDVDGLVTIEDILEEIVGEIEDEYDVEKGGLVERLRNGTMVIDASASLKDLKEIGLPFSDEDLAEYNTLAGFMLAKLQRIPRGGEFVIHNGYRFTVVDMEKNRIAKVKVESLQLMGRLHQKAL
ncbi:MAG TPA: HlyC/CorC family transporter, partial [Deltaproteobacteria bacterium]|nr:HlyC/CorC family transporter [Deltaproteobacteria bacterium]